MAIRIYIIDEHPSLRMNLVRRLSSAEEIDVVGCSGDAATALRDVRNLHPDIVLLEVKMKEADGIEVCSQAAQTDSGLKVVVITSFVDPEERRKVQQAGAYAYLLKDLDTPGLVERLRALVGPFTLRTVNCCD